MVHVHQYAEEAEPGYKRYHAVTHMPSPIGSLASNPGDIGTRWRQRPYSDERVLAFDLSNLASQSCFGIGNVDLTF